MNKLLKIELNKYRLASMEYWLSRKEYKLVDKYHDMSDEDLLLTAIRRAKAEKQDYVNDIRKHFERRNKKWHSNNSNQIYIADQDKE